MPNRIIRDGILTSKRIAALPSADAECFYRRLMSVVDDYGRYYADAQLLLSACYPRQPDRATVKKIQQWLDDCTAARLIHRYHVDGEEYLELLDFRQQIRAKTSRYPACIADATQVPSTPPACAHLDGDEGVVEDEDEDEDVGVCEDDNARARANAPGGFDAWWEVYPRKAKKKPAREVWKRKRLDPMTDVLIADTQRRQQSDRRWLDGFVPDPTTYLNQERWTDEIDTRRHAGGNGSGQSGPRESLVERVRRLNGLDPATGDPILGAHDGDVRPSMDDGPRGDAAKGVVVDGDFKVERG